MGTSTNLVPIIDALEPERLIVGNLIPFTLVSLIEVPF